MIYTRQPARRGWQLYRLAPGQWTITTRNRNFGHRKRFQGRYKNGQANQYWQRRFIEAGMNEYLMVDSSEYWDEEENGSLEYWAGDVMEDFNPDCEYYDKGLCDCDEECYDI